MARREAADGEFNTEFLSDRFRSYKVLEVHEPKRRFLSSGFSQTVELETKVGKKKRIVVRGSKETIARQTEYIRKIEEYEAETGRSSLDPLGRIQADSRRVEATTLRMLFASERRIVLPD